MKAVIDRFEGEYAVLLVGEDEIKVDIPRQILPKSAKEGTWLTLTLELDPEGTKKQKKKMEDKLKKLLEKNK